ncbi:MAG: succinate dehydrogenase, cytochrome b556 subunit [Gammaproteobacteria bacterium]|nr:succinate dehydrogenase, cytochrome b556 subunit [Gammaproteobacteria bacterium]
MFTRGGRPVYLNLAKIHLPISGIISIMHRVFGLLLALSIPFFTLLFGLSLQSEAGYNQALTILNSMWLTPIYILLIWSFIHHFFAGIRYLLLDVEIGVEKEISQKSSWLVMYAAIAVSLIICAGIWL